MTIRKLRIRVDSVTEKHRGNMFKKETHQQSQQKAEGGKVVKTETKIVRLPDGSVQRQEIITTETVQTVYSSGSSGVKTTRSVTTSNQGAAGLEHKMASMQLHSGSKDTKALPNSAAAHKRSPSPKKKKDSPKAKSKGLMGRIKDKIKGDDDSSSSSNSDSSDESDFEEDCLKAHNEYRKKHGAAPLKLNRKLTKYAREWAQKLARDDRMQHRPDHTYGENIFMKWSSDPKHRVTGRDAVDSWYAEIKDHNYTADDMGKSGHFTQVVWKNSKELGVAKRRTKSGKIVVVANYDPAGNWIGQFRENVARPN